MPDHTIARLWPLSGLSLLLLLALQRYRIEGSILQKRFYNFRILVSIDVSLSVENYGNFYAKASIRFILVEARSHIKSKTTKKTSLLIYTYIPLQQFRK